MSANESRYCPHCGRPEPIKAECPPPACEPREQCPPPPCRDGRRDDCGCVDKLIHAVGRLTSQRDRLMDEMGLREPYARVAEIAGLPECEVRAILGDEGASRGG